MAWIQVAAHLRQPDDGIVRCISQRNSFDEHDHRYLPRYSLRLALRRPGPQTPASPVNPALHGKPSSPWEAAPHYKTQRAGRYPSASPLSLEMMESRPQRPLSSPRPPMIRLYAWRPWPRGQVSRYQCARAATICSAACTASSRVAQVASLPGKGASDSTCTTSMDQGPPARWQSLAM